MNLGLPPAVERRLAEHAQSNRYVRRNVFERRAARRELRRLGVDLQSAFGRFYARINTVAFFSAPGVLLELNELLSPTPQLSETSRYSWEELGLSRDVLTLTSWEGEGAVLYAKSTGAVYDLGWDRIDALNAGVERPTWPDFETFLEHYVLGDPDLKDA